MAAKIESYKDIQVLIADDHPLFRAALKQSVNELFEPPIIETSNLHETMQALASNSSIELIFLDINMPGNDGLKGLVDILTVHPDLTVIMISAYDENAVIAKSVELGASGFIPKSTDLAQIKLAVESVLNGEVWLPCDIDQLSAVDDTLSEKFSRLTPHQLKVLQHMAAGLLNKQIAHEMGISESTVKQHASAVLKKLGIINRTQASVIYKQYLAVQPQSPLS